MNLTKWYQDNLEDRISGRYLPLKKVQGILEQYRKEGMDITLAGISEEQRDIPLIRLGNGKTKVLAWSQMHGNETTTTKALFDFLKFISHRKYLGEEIGVFNKKYSFYVIPILNPDGSERYTRENGNGKDLNRDFQDFSQAETRILRDLYEQVQPDFCLNLHDQRSVFGFESGKPATVSFLAPAADPQRQLTSSRIAAMGEIARMAGFLNNYIPGRIGRFDDSFNPACAGDFFQMKNTPTILFEAGHYENDYEREKTRELIFYAYLVFFGIIKDKEGNTEDYLNLPENQMNFQDVIIRNIKIIGEKSAVDFAIQYEEKLQNGKIFLIPEIKTVNPLHNLYGHFEYDAKQLLTVDNHDNNLTKIVKVLSFLSSDYNLPANFHKNVF